MQNVKINEINYNVPTRWSELTLAKAIDVMFAVNDKQNQLSLLTGIPADTIDKLLDVDAQRLFTLISFVDEMDVFNLDNVLPEFESFNFGNISYGDAEKCRAIMKESSNAYLATIRVIDFLTKKYLSNEKFLDTIGTVNFFFINLKHFMIVTPYLTKVNMMLSQSKRV